MQQFDPIDPADMDFFQFDCADPAVWPGPLLGPGDTIVTASISTSVLRPPTSGATPAILATIGAQISGTPTAPASRVTTQVQPGGTQGTLYAISCLIVTASGRTLERSGSVLVIDL